MKCTCIPVYCSSSKLVVNKTTTPAGTVDFSTSIFQRLFRRPIKTVEISTSIRCRISIKIARWDRHWRELEIHYS